MTDKLKVSPFDDEIKTLRDTIFELSASMLSQSLMMVCASGTNRSKVDLPIEPTGKVPLSLYLFCSDSNSGFSKSRFPHWKFSRPFGSMGSVSSRVRV